MTEHTLQLPGTEWSVWRDVLVRSAGFPVSGLDRLTSPRLAAVADAFVAGDGDEAELTTELATAALAADAAASAIAADDRFRQAVHWQNPDVAATIGSATQPARTGPPNYRQRRRAEVIGKYWQRYCAKNDTIGFFGPMCWTEVTDSGPAISGGPGPGLERRRAVHFEWWVLTAFADALATDPELRVWFPVLASPHLTVREREVVAPGQAVQPLTRSAAALVAAARAGGSLRETARQLVDAGAFRRVEDVYVQVDELEQSGVLRVGIDLPVDLSAERVLREWVAGIDDADLRARAAAPLERMWALRDAASAATDAADLAAAVAGLDTAFTDFTGQPPRRRPGQTYAGRTLCHLDTSRDLDLRFGPLLLDKLAPLEPLLRSARWLTAAVATALHEALLGLHAELAADSGTAEVPLHDLWFLAQGLVLGADRPADAVVADFLRRWHKVLDLDGVAPDVRELTLSTAELTRRVDEAFEDTDPGWWEARIHSPDVHVCAPDWAAVQRGDYRLVLGELHMAMAAFNTDFFRLGHPAPDRLAEALRADLPEPRVHLLLPDEWPRNCARNANWIKGPRDVQLAFAPSAGADRDRLLPVTGVVVVAGPDGLVARAADGRTWPLLEVYAELLNISTFDTWKFAGSAAHTPRVVVDDLVLLRETWRTTVGASGLADATGDRERVLAARRWRRDWDLPDRIFVKIGSETKPFYADLGSLSYVRQLCSMARGARQAHGEDVELTVTEMLPDATDAWLVDAAGDRYTSELRLHLRDERTPRHARRRDPA
ncbi:lantibiotic dehydratase [Plantactinospora sp. GCM10030261]|uniref:lantibiotic dehydratase n=1 Tax=Plantactinospora sp. GCM10030261 TaxID=3273420 RepID=UPI00361E1512